MSTDPNPLKYMGTQSQETVNLADAMAQRFAHGSTLAPDSEAEKLRRHVGDASDRTAQAANSIGDAAQWVVGQATDSVKAAARTARQSSTQAIETYTRDDPIRALLIAAGTGALLMGLVAMIARSGGRSVRRRVGA